MKKVSFICIGMGNRGYAYTRRVVEFADRMEVVAISDPKPECIERANKYLHLPPEKIYKTGEELLVLPKMADIAIIATQDRQHKKYALAAMEKGYDLILEKPIAVTPEDCKEISDAAVRLGRKVVVCHVLRYAPFYRKIKEMILDGVVGKVETVQATEGVGYWHFAHSYVRGNWHKEADSSPAILAKSCHDLDLFVWLTGQKCKRVSSFGSLDYFNKENCPENAAARCLDCPVKDCPFEAKKFYLSRMPHWPTNVLHPEPTEERVLKALRTTDYGRCVFQMDNDVVDHQVVNLLMEDGCTVSFQMLGFTNENNRTIRVMGTEGEIWGSLDDAKVYYRRFGEEQKVIDVNLSGDLLGHGGGDQRLVRDVIGYEAEDEDFDGTSLTSIDVSVESHFIAFAAEYSRTHNGESVDMEEFVKNI